MSECTDEWYRDALRKRLHWMIFRAVLPFWIVLVLVGMFLLAGCGEGEKEFEQVAKAGGAAWRCPPGDYVMVHAAGLEAVAGLPTGLPVCVPWVAAKRGQLPLEGTTNTTVPSVTYQSRLGTLTGPAALPDQIPSQYMIGVVPSASGSR